MPLNNILKIDTLANDTSPCQNIYSPPLGLVATKEKILVDVKLYLVEMDVISRSYLEFSSNFVSQDS